MKTECSNTSSVLDPQVAHELHSYAFKQMCYDVHVYKGFYSGCGSTLDSPRQQIEIRRSSLYQHHVEGVLHGGQERPGN